MCRNLAVEINAGARISAHEDSRYNHSGMIRTGNSNQNDGEIQTQQNYLKPECALVHQISSDQISHDDEQTGPHQSKSRNLIHFPKSIQAL